MISVFEAHKVLLDFILHIDPSELVMIIQLPKRNPRTAFMSKCNLHLLHSLSQVSSVSAAGYLPGSRCHAPPCWRWQEALHYCCKSQK